MTSFLACTVQLSVHPTRLTNARRIWNAKFDRRPSLIVRCADQADVKRAVDFARAEDLLVAVRSGGHSWAGYSTCDGGLVIDLSGMKQFDVDRGRESPLALKEPILVLLNGGGTPAVPAGRFTETPTSRPGAAKYEREPSRRSITTPRLQQWTDKHESMQC